METELKIGEWYLTDYAGGKYVQIIDIIDGKKDRIISWRCAFGFPPRKIGWLASLTGYYFIDCDTESFFKKRLI